MADEARERERAADERARLWLTKAELANGLLRKAEARADFAQVEKQAAERMLAAEQAARQMAEHMLAAEAALADAADALESYLCSNQASNRTPCK